MRLNRLPMLMAAQVLLACGCFSRAAPLALPACIRAESASHSDGITEFTFDPEGDLTGIVELDNAGSELARTTLTWSADGITVSRKGRALSFEQRGRLGAHGELLEMVSPEEHAQLRWEGSFEAAATPAVQRFAFETYYHLVSDEVLVPLDTSARGVWPRMRAFVFTGTVVVHREGTPEAEDSRATYEQGHQVECTVFHRSGHHLSKTTTVWQGRVPVEQTTTTGDPSQDLHRTFTSANGHLQHIAGAPDVTFTYDAGGRLTRVVTNPGGAAQLQVDLSPCPVR